MADFFNNLFGSGAMQALETTWSFTHAHHRVLAENIANLGTPGYVSKQLDYGDFQKALGEALERRGDDRSRPPEFQGSRQVRSERGRLRFDPQEKPADNVLFHDGTNASLEREMADLAQNAIVHELTTQLLATRFNGLRKAIRGQA